MSLLVGTHSGTFHADDVLAFALLRAWVDADATVLRTRDRQRLGECDVVIDVGGEFDPARCRFDHHQGAYTGPLSSAGMVLDWLVAEGRITADLGHHLRTRLVDYVDAVDTGREAPRVEVPCFARMVEAFGMGAETPEQQQAAFLAASDVALRFLQGLSAGHAKVCEARNAIVAAMEEAVVAGRSVVFLDRYYPWKQVYFEYGGGTHPTDYVLFPSEDDTWKLVAIPPRLGMFEQKRPLPASWAGKMGAELDAATGVEGSVFCHKNRFIAVFRSKEATLAALDRFGLLHALPAIPDAGLDGACARSEPRAAAGVGR